MQDLNQQLARVLKQKETEAGKCTLEEWEKERLVLKEELENSKIKVWDYAVFNGIKQLTFQECTGGISIIPFSSCVWSFKAEFSQVVAANVRACEGGRKARQQPKAGR